MAGGSVELCKLTLRVSWGLFRDLAVREGFWTIGPSVLSPKIWNPYTPNIYHLRISAHSLNPTQTRKTIYGNPDVGHCFRRLWRSRQNTRKDRLGKSLAAIHQLMRAMAYLFGCHHIYTHIIPLRRYGRTGRTSNHKQHPGVYARTVVGIVEK